MTREQSVIIMEKKWAYCDLLRRGLTLRPRIIKHLHWKALRERFSIIGRNSLTPTFPSEWVWKDSDRSEKVWRGVCTCVNPREETKIGNHPNCRRSNFWRTQSTVASASLNAKRLSMNRFNMFISNQVSVKSYLTSSTSLPSRCSAHLRRFLRNLPKEDEDAFVIPPEY